MKIKEGKSLLQDFIKKAVKDKDPFLLVHFSGADDKFNGMHEGLDKLDAQIILKELVRFFKFNDLDIEVLKQTTNATVLSLSMKNS